LFQSLNELQTIFQIALKDQSLGDPIEKTPATTYKYQIETNLDQ
jgi:hypothetical protein